METLIIDLTRVGIIARRTLAGAALAGLLAAAVVPTGLAAGGDGRLDDDGDGLIGFDELAYGTDVFNPDTDADGLLDGDEFFVYGTNPLNPDTDDDLNLDGDEIFLLGSNPLVFDRPASDPRHAGMIDRDQDGLSDGDELSFYRTDPFAADTDGDGSADADELRDGTDPLLDNRPGASRPEGLDSDGDLLTDEDELNVFGTDPNEMDTDGDNAADGYEVSSGTDPFDPRSTPQGGVG